MFGLELAGARLQGDTDSGGEGWLAHLPSLDVVARNVNVRIDAVHNLLLLRDYGGHLGVQLAQLHKAPTTKAPGQRWRAQPLGQRTHQPIVPQNVRPSPAAVPTPRPHEGTSK